MRHNQPQSGPVNPDISNEFGRWLRAAVIGAAHKIEPISRKAVTYGSSVSKVSTRNGYATQHAATNSQVSLGATGGLGTIVPVGAAWSIFVRLQVTALGVRQIFVGDNNAAGAGNSFYVEFTAANVWRFEVATPVPSTKVVTGGTVTLGWHDVLVTYQPGTGTSMYVDGAMIGSIAFTDNLVSGTALRVGSAGLTNTISFQGRIAACYFFGKVFTSAQRRALSDNPWQVFKTPQPIYLYKAAGGVVIPSGTLSSTLAGVTFAASGATVNAGVLDSTLDGCTMAAAGAVGSAPAGTFASSLAGVSMAAGGAIVIPGALASTMSGVTMTSTGAVNNRGALAAALDGASMAAAGAVSQNATGTFASTLDGASMAAYGYNGIPPALPDFFLRLPKNPRHIQRRT